MSTRTCTSTGLSIVAGPASGHRVATTTHGPMNPVLRRSPEPRDDWSRWDAPGRTLYFAETLEIAFRECLAWARMTPTHGKQLGKLAALWSITTEQVMQEIADDFERLGHMQPGHLPYAWRDSRLKHVISVPESAGPWVDVEAEATLDALSTAVGIDIRPYTDREEVDRAAIFSNDRNVTTRIAEWLRNATLDDGAEPAGIRFRSRLGDGYCWAYWMRRADLGLSEIATATAGTEILRDDPALNAVTNAWDIHTW